MTIIEWINTGVVVLGLPTIIGVAVNMGRKLNTLETIDTDIRDNIKPDLKDIRERFMVVESRVETLWQEKFAPAHSPRQLNTRGLDILNESGIRGIIENQKEKLTNIVRQGNIANPYDAEQTILSVVADLPKYCPEIVDELKVGAFKVGQSIDTVLFVGGIHLRDLIFSDLGFSLTDLDKPQGN